MTTFNSQQPRTMREKEKIPTFLIRVIMGLLVVCLCLVTWARLTDRPLESEYTEMGIAEQREIVLSGEMSGAAKVTTPDGTLIADLDSTKGGFVAGIWRVMERERMKRGLPPGAPVSLIRYVDGRLGLEDKTTGWKIALVGFGAGNMDAFAQLLR